eukprot:scaffold3864_cov59-Phaeocystis_antarctica.AAC.2
MENGRTRIKEGIHIQQANRSVSGELASLSTLSPHFAKSASCQLPRMRGVRPSALALRRHSGSPQAASRGAFERRPLAMSL